MIAAPCLNACGALFLPKTGEFSGIVIKIDLKQKVEEIDNLEKIVDFT